MRHDDKKKPNFFRGLKKLPLPGFTLVEVLIVVIILGILAALVIPRIVSQPERARTAEAAQMLSALRRAQLARLDLMGTPEGSYLIIGDNLNASTWNQLGLLAPGATATGMNGINGNPAGPIYYTYYCGGNACSATLAGTGAADVITLNDDGTFTCQGAFENSGGTAGAPCIYVGGAAPVVGTPFGSGP